MKERWTCTKRFVKISGVIWGMVYHKTGSLRHCIIAHGIVDMLNLSVWVSHVPTRQDLLERIPSVTE